MTCGTNTQIFLQQGAETAEGPFTVTANILPNKEWKTQVKKMWDFKCTCYHLLVNQYTFRYDCLTRYLIITQDEEEQITEAAFVIIDIIGKNHVTW